MYFFENLLYNNFFLNFEFDLNFLYLISFFIIILGFMGYYVHDNIIFTLMSMEVLFSGIFFHFILGSILWNDLMGQIFALFILTIVAAESAIALALIVAFYKLYGSIHIHIVANNLNI